TVSHAELFLVAEWPGREFRHDTYVLPLSDPIAIGHARKLIECGPEEAGQPIVVARIVAGADGINRTYRDPDAPPWSWHVVEFVDFADATIEILAGGPSMVELDVEGWIENTHGLVGFWSYTVVEELD